MKTSKTKTKKRLPTWVPIVVIIAVVVIVVTIFGRGAYRANQPIRWTAQMKAEHQRFLEEVRSGKRRPPGVSAAAYERFLEDVKAGKYKLSDALAVLGGRGGGAAGPVQPSQQPQSR